MENTDKKVYWVRASSFKEMFDCPHRWYGNNILKIKRPSNFKAHVGSSVHKALEIHDLAKLTGKSFLKSPTALMKQAMKGYEFALKNPQYEILPPEAKDVEAMTKVGKALIERYCQEIAPNYNFSHIELKCKTLKIEVGNVILEITGTIDRIYQEEIELINRYGIADIKTGGMAVNAQNEVEVVAHKAQLGVYEILAEHTLDNIKVDADAHIIGLQTNTKARVAIGKTKSARDVVLGTEHEIGMLGNAGKLLEHQIFFGNPSSMMCGEKYCPMYKTCKYRGADAVEIKEEADFEIEKKESALELIAA